MGDCELDLLRRLLAHAPQKRRVLELVARGSTNPEVATQIGRTVDDVKKLLQVTYDATGLHNRVKLTRAFLLLCAEEEGENYPEG